MKEHRLPHCEHSACSKPRVKGLHKIHHFLCEKSSHYHSWHHHKHHRKAHYGILAIYLIAIIAGTIFSLMPQKSLAATSFEAHFDSGSLDADSSIGSGTASNDGTPATLTTGNGGYGGTGEAVTVAQGQTLKYSVQDNLDPAKGEIEMKVKMPVQLNGVDTTIGRFNQPGGITYDPLTDYIYVVDSSNVRIVRTKIDGTGWATFGSSGSGKGQFSFGGDHGHGIYIDPTTKYLYITDKLNRRIVKTQFDGTGWTTYGSNGSGVGQFSNPMGIFYDSSSEYIYVSDTGNHRIIKTKIDGTGWTTYGSSGSGVGNFSGPRGVFYDNNPASSSYEYLYISDYSNHRIVKTKIDGTGWTTYGSSGSGTGNFNSPNGIWYDSNSEFIFISDSGNHRLVKTKIDGTGWTTATGMSNTPGGVYYNASDEYLYTILFTASLVKTKIDGSRTNFGIGAGADISGSISNPQSVYYDSASQYYYIADYGYHRIIKTKSDGTGFSTLGGRGSGNYRFYNPRAIWYDPVNDFVYVVDAGNYRIIKTKIDGTGWTAYGGTQGTGTGQFKDLKDLIYDSANDFLYVLDNYHANSHSIKIIKTKLDDT